MAELTVVLTHEHADFDALASLHAASRVFPGALPVLPRQRNRNVQAFLALYRNHFPFLEPHELPRGHVETAILVDTRSANAVKGMDPHTRYLVIDHHESQEPLPPGWQEWEAGFRPYTVGANTTLLVEKLMVQSVDLTPLQATLLALGIYEDTGSLLYRSTTHRDIRCAAWLVEQGANLEVVHRFTHFPLSPEQQALYQKLVENSQHHRIGGHSVVLATAVAPEFQDELSALAHKLRELYEPDALFLVVDLGDRVQVVARSTTDGVDVGAVAEALGGGGHTRAAAALLRDTDPETVRRQILELLPRYVRPPVTVAHIMSRGRPLTVSPDTPIQEAVRRLRRYGHEGAPVVAREAPGEEQVVGILTRREADRALDHRLGHLPVRKIMRPGHHTVHPSTPVEALSRLMVETGWGQIPVVDAEGRLVGIVTRTDLLKLWGQGHPAEPPPPNLAQALEQTLTPAQHRLLRLVGQEAMAQGYTAYVVGGFVRDLLLGRVTPDRGLVDVDIVVEGNAIQVARKLQERCGGRVVAHRRFGTAKWILDEPEHPLRCAELTQEANHLPPHLDLVTARKEFYAEPTVLPTVEQGSIKLDLHRRDFTINTLAISLTPDRWGELLDFYGGLADLRAGVIRVLHSLSFVEDPTRILRAVRYEQRFGFQIEERTLELLQDAVDLLRRVTPARIRHELERILQEERPERSLQRLDELGVLQQIHPCLQGNGSLAQRFQRLRQALAQGHPLAQGATEPPEGDPLERIYWSLWTYPCLPGPQEPPERLAQVIQELDERLRLRRETQRLMRQLGQVKPQVPELLRPETPPSRVVALLERTRPAVWLVLAIAEDHPLLEERLIRYREEWRHVRPELTGVDLQAMGLPRGPLYARLLAALRAARVDGQVRSRTEEEALIQRLLRQGDLQEAGRALETEDEEKGPQEDR